MPAAWLWIPTKGRALDPSLVTRRERSDGTSIPEEGQHILIILMRSVQEQVVWGIRTLQPIRREMETRLRRVLR